jgi:hypothetical protein
MKLKKKLSQLSPLFLSLIHAQSCFAKQFFQNNLALSRKLLKKLFSKKTAVPNGASKGILIFISMLPVSVNEYTPRFSVSVFHI